MYNLSYIISWNNVFIKLRKIVCEIVVLIKGENVCWFYIKC